MTVKPKTSGPSHGGVVIESTAFEETIEHVKAGAMKTAEQISEFNKGNVDALVKSSTIFAQGMQEIGKIWAASAQASVQESMSTFKALTTVKSLKEAVDLQTTYTRGAIEKTLANGSKVTEHTLKLAEEALAPLSARLNAAVEAFTAH